MPRILLHLADRRRRVIDPHDVYYLEADRDDTVVRFRSRHTLRDLRPLAELEPIARPGFFRVHQSFLVNLDRVYEIRPRSPGSRDWELAMEPPVNRVIPISRERLGEFWDSYEPRRGDGRATTRTISTTRPRRRSPAGASTPSSKTTDRWR